MKRITIFIINDYDILMKGIEVTLKSSDYFKIVGKTDSLQIAEKSIGLKSPDLVFIDTALGEESIQGLINFIKKEHHNIKIIAFSTHDDFLNVSLMLKAGIVGYLLKSIKSDELYLAINRVMLGEIYIQSSIAPMLLNGFQKSEKVEWVNNLSPREIQIIRLVAQEYTSSSIGKILFISEHTVETHRKNIWRKTGVKSTIGLVNFAKQHNLL